MSEEAGICFNVNGCRMVTIWETKQEDENWERILTKLGESVNEGITVSCCSCEFRH